MDYLKALEEERKKILVFERELPFSLQLVTQAIETCKKQMQEEVVVGSEEITCGGPILEEFMPLRPSYSSSDEENHHRHQNKNTDRSADKKPDWLRSVQLWNQQPSDQSSPKKDGVMRPIAVNATRIGGAFHPFEREKVSVVKTPAPVVAAQASSTTENNIHGEEEEEEEEEEKEKEKEKEGNSQRKTRRCWSPELHRRFLHALQQLGGSHVATPKQIRELMKVDGLTNDEVKSHLQKYRLHTRRPTAPTIQSSSNGSPPRPHILLVGGLWVPPPEYTTAATLNGIFVPTASLPSESGSQNKQKTGKKSSTALVNSERRCKGLDNMERSHSDSSAISSASQTTTASPPLQAC